MVMGWFDRLTMTFVILSLSKDGARRGDCMVMLSCFHEDWGLSLSGFNELFLTQGRKQVITSEGPMTIGAENERKDKPLSS